MKIRPDLDDKTRIILLKGLVGVGMAGTFANLFFLWKMEKLVEQVSKERNHFAKQLKIAAKIINRFSDMTDDEINTKIYDEFAFEWITLGIEDDSPDEGKKKK
jgi:hypothetical protein